MRLQQYVQKGSFYKAVVEDGSDIIFVVDYTGKIHYHNTSVHETLGYRSNSLTNKNIFDYIVKNKKIKYRDGQNVLDLTIDTTGWEDKGDHSMTFSWGF